MYIMVDVEADGPVPGLYSMVSFGAVVVEEGLHRTFYGECRPLTTEWIPEALSVSGFTREETLNFPSVSETMWRFMSWLDSLDASKLYFISDNNGFDWQFMNYYLWFATNGNPFGHSSTNLGSLYKGMEKSMFKNFKHLRKTKHTHNPVDDAKGNAEALLHMKEIGLLEIRL